MSYWENREERLTYQKEYNKSEYYKAYQQDYYDKNKDYFKEKNRKYNLTHKKEYVRKPLAQYKLDAIERVLRKKLKEYNKSLLQENVKITCAPPVISFCKKENETFSKKDVISNNKQQITLPNYPIRNNKFVITF